MATIPSTIKEFNADCAKFMRHIGDRRKSQESIKMAHKAITLRYLGLTSATDREVESAADILQCMTQNALQRGWTL